MKDCYISSLIIPTSGVSHLAFHPNMPKILVSSRTGGILLYNIEKQSRPFAFQAKGFSPIRSYISPDGDFVVGVSYEGKIGFWRNHNSKPESLFSGHPSKINDMAVCGNKSHFITAANDKVVKLWDVKANEDDVTLKFVTSYTFHKSPVTACSCDQNSTVCVSGDSSGECYMWDYREQNESTLIYQTKSSKRDLVQSIGVNISTNTISVLSDRGHLAIVDSRNPFKPLSPVFRAYPSMLKMHPRHPYVMFGGNDNSIMCFDVESNSLLYSFEGHKAPNTCICWSDNGKSFASADADGTVII